MTAKTPEPPQESRPSTAASSTSSVPAQSKPSQPPQPAQPSQSAGDATTATTATTPIALPAGPAAAQPAKGTAPAVAPAKASAAPPAARPPAPRPAAQKSRGGSGGAAFVVAVLAVLIAIGSAAVAVYALDVAREAKSNTAETAASNRPVPPAATGAATDPAQAAPTPTTARPQFLAELVRAELRIPPADGCASVFVDVDTMQVGVFSGHEFYLSSCLGPPALRIDKTSGAVPTAENPTPEVCAAQLAGSTTTTELVLQVRTGLTFCLLTNKEDATRLGIPQRIGVVEVREVGADKSVTIAVSTYRVPNQIG